MSWSDLNSELDAFTRKVQWTENNVHYLVNLYQQNQCLWKKDSPLYLNYYARRLAYQTIHEEVSALDVTVVEVIMKLREVRKTYVNELQKIVEAEAFGLSYKSQYIWFDTINDFLCTYLHIDEIETVEKPLREDYCRNLYRNEKVDHDSCSTKSDDMPCSELSIPVRPSSGLSSSVLTSPLRPHPSSSSSSEEDNAHLTQIRKFPDGSAKNLQRISPDSRIRQPPPTPRRVRSSSRKGGCVGVCKTESIQPRKTNEGSVKLSSRQSWITARISCDQFDLFASNVACRLKQMKPDAAATAQMEIQKVLTNAGGETGSNAPSKYTFTQGNDDPNYKVISLYPCSQERSWVSQESNIND